MGVLDTAIDHRSHAYLGARSESLAALTGLEVALDRAREGGGERAITRHHARGRLLPRERIELLVDRDSPLLELSPVAGWGSGGSVGAAVVTAIGVVEARPSVIIADDPTVPAGSGGATTLRKVRRAQQIAEQNRLPVIRLTEAVAEPMTDLTPGRGAVDAYVESGQVTAGFARLCAAGVPTIEVCFGGLTSSRELLEQRGSDHTIVLRSPNGQLPPPARHADSLAEDERDAVRLARECARRFPPPRCSGMPAAPPHPTYDPEDLLGVSPGEPREILARMLDGSGFDEVLPGYGEMLCAGWGELHGHRVAVLATTTAPGYPAEAAEKTRRMLRLAERAGAPVVCLLQGSGPVASVPVAVPLLSVRVGHWQGPPGVPAQARFRFAWPHTTGARECPALELSGALEDDGIIDPRDTRTVLGLCLSVMGP